MTSDGGPRWPSLHHGVNWGHNIRRSWQVDYSRNQSFLNHQLLNGQMGFIFRTLVIWWPRYTLHLLYVLCGSTVGVSLSTWFHLNHKIFATHPSKKQEYKLQFRYSLTSCSNIDINTCRNSRAALHSSPTKWEQKENAWIKTQHLNIALNIFCFCVNPKCFASLFSFPHKMDFFSLSKRKQ